MKNNKLKPTVKTALVYTLAATSTAAIAYATPKIIENKSKNTENKFVLDVKKVDSDTVKVSLDNIEDIPKALQFSLKLDGIVLKEENGKPVIKDLINPAKSDKIITDYTYNKENNTIDVLITAQDSIPKTGNEIDVFELDIQATENNKSRKYSIKDEEKSEYKYVSNTNKEYVRSVSVKNEELTLNTNPTVKMKEGKSYIEITEGETIQLTEEVLKEKGLEIEDADKDKVTLEVKDASDKKITSFKGTEEGIYDLYITAKDDFGGESKTLNVQLKVNASTVGPTITRDGKALEDVTINAGQALNLMDSIKAVDVNGNTVNVSVSSDKELNLDTEQDTTYVITYSATDSRGRKTEKTINLTVKGNKAPVIEGVKSHTLKVGDSFDPKAGVTVTDEDVEKYYNENIDKYKKKAGANAKHILFESEDEALAAKAKIDSGETTFDALFEQYKGNASGKFPKAEDLGYVENDKENFDTDFLAGFKQLKEGEISAPVKSSFGYHIIKVEGVQAEDTTTPLDEVKDSIKSTLETDKKKEVYNSTLEQWKKDLKVKTYENRL